MVLSLASLNVFSQEVIHAKGIFYTNKVYIRWLPSTLPSFKQCNSEGYIIKKIAWNKNILPDSNAFKKPLKIEIIKSKTADDAYWKNEIAETNFMYSVLYKTNSKGVNDNQIYYNLALLSCDFDTSLAINSGLMFVEKDIEEASFAYLIQPVNKVLQRKMKPGIIVVNAALSVNLPPPDSLKAIAKGKEIKLIWPEEKYSDFYAGYFIERSENGIDFKRLNKKPQIQIKTKDEKNKTEIIFNDTTIKYNVLYTYRVNGLNFFGPLGPYSNTVQIKSMEPLNAFVSFDSAVVYNDSLYKIKWHLIAENDINTISGYHVYRSSKDNGNYKRISNDLLMENSFIDKNPLSSNYYKVMAYSIHGDSVLSNSILGVIPDIKPPKIPVEFKGEIDSTGKVILTWKQNEEIDLKGYRIFRCNALNEEPAEITKKIIKENKYSDKIDINTLTENVYYFITAVDNVFNNSKYSLPLKLKRPDKIKPVPIVFTSLMHNDSCIIINWNNSSSSDASKYVLYRMNSNKQEKYLMEWPANDSLSSFCDTGLATDNYYTYKIIVMDNSGNLSETISPPHYFSSFFEDRISEFNYNINFESKTIQLIWNYPGKEVFSFILYKGKNDNEALTYKTFKSNTNSFIDKELNIGNVYKYKIKAILSNGKESKFSNELKIEF
jgi:fibronectin type 3 domain-containing protein